MNYVHESGISYHVPDCDREERVWRTCRNPLILAFTIKITILFVSFIVVMIFIYSFLIRPKDKQLSESSTGPTAPPIDNEESTFCVHRRFAGLSVDILYSFDCSNATDDISGTYNGVPDALLHPDFSSQTIRALLPTYVTPDYSGQGAALKLNSSIIYQYIDLLRSPKFFSQTFTISAWIKPDLPANSEATLAAQSYEDSNLFAIYLLDLRPGLNIYGVSISSDTQLKNLQWHHVTFCFVHNFLEVDIYIDGIFHTAGAIPNNQYGNFKNPKTNIGSVGGLSIFNGLIDQLSIAFREKWREEVLDEATLVVFYTFEGVDEGNDKLFDDESANSIRATGAHVTRSIGNRRVGEGTLSLYDSALSWFQSSGFVLLFTHNYTYSYALWLYANNVSSFMPLIHLVAEDDISVGKNNDSICLAMLVVNNTDPSTNTIQLSLYINGPTGYHIITSTKMLSQSSWFHVIVVSGSNGFDLYVNGALVASSGHFNVTSIQWNNQQRLTLTIGNPKRASIDDNLYGAMCLFHEDSVESNGSIIEVDNLRFYSRTLKLKEIEAVANDVLQPSRFFFDL